MKKKSELVPVVTAFLYSGDRIALIKRSERVRTYRGAWAAFSGYMEHLPLKQAWTELSEEAGVTEGQARLMGMGVPLPVDDPDTGDCWLVYPFLFELSGGVEIRTDWEAAEWGWFSPEEIPGMKTVPGLDAALARVWPHFGDRELWRSLGEVALDTMHGATELARRGLTALGRFVQDYWEMLDHEGLLRSIRAFAASRPTMGVFPDLAARLLLAVEREGGQFDFDVLITELLSAVEDATDLSVDTAAEGIVNCRRVFTLSYSEAVRDTILAWFTAESEVVVAESHPGGEGLALAKFLREREVPVRTVPDSDTEAAMCEVDAVLVGCDGITADDMLLNKIGTRNAVRAAREAGIPAFAVAQTFKVNPPDWPWSIEQQDEGPVFDLTPLNEFQAVFTEEGELQESRLQELRAELSSVELVPV